jgi:hypothetical protein
MLTAYLDESGQEQDDWMFIADSWAMMLRGKLSSLCGQRRLGRSALICT